MLRCKTNCKSAKAAKAVIICHHLPSSAIISIIRQHPPSSAIICHHPPSFPIFPTPSYNKSFVSEYINPQTLHICLIELLYLYFNDLATLIRCSILSCLVECAWNNSLHISSRYCLSSCIGIDNRDIIPSMFSISSSFVLHMK